MLAKKFCDERAWMSQPINEAHVTLKRVRDEKDVDYAGPVKGIEIQPHEDSEPLRLEFDRDLYVQDFTKTQFAPIEIHVQVVELLHLLIPQFESIEVTDEGEYFETGDLTLLAQHRNRCLEVLDELLAQSDKHSGPVRIAGNRIADLMSRD